MLHWEETVLNWSSESEVQIMSDLIFQMPGFKILNTKNIELHLLHMLHSTCLSLTFYNSWFASLEGSLERAFKSPFISEKKMKVMRFLNCLSLFYLTDYVFASTCQKMNCLNVSYCYCQIEHRISVPCDVRLADTRN